IRSVPAMDCAATCASQSNRQNSACECPVHRALGCGGRARWFHKLFPPDSWRRSKTARRRGPRRTGRAFSLAFRLPAAFAKQWIQKKTKRSEKNRQPASTAEDVREFHLVDQNITRHKHAGNATDGARSNDQPADPAHVRETLRRQPDHIG